MAAAPAASAALPPESAASNPDMQLVFRTVTLPSGRRGQAYGPHQVVRGGTPPYRVLFNGRLPPGLELGSDGMLRGTPTTTGGYRFTLLVLDTAHPTQGIEQPYVLYVNPPLGQQAARPASAPASAVPPPRPKMTGLTAEDVDITANQHVGQPASYKLTPADVAKLVPTEVVGAPALELAPVAATELARAAPTLEQLQAIVKPVTDVEYPTLAAFSDALKQGRCAYYQAHVNEIALKRGMVPDTRCPPAPPPPVRRGAAASELPFLQFYNGLLAPDTVAEIVGLAEKRHPFGLAKPMQLDGQGCGCAPIRHDDEVIGFLPYWLAGDAPLPVDFSLFTRLSYMGVVLGDNGAWARPPGWDGTGKSNFASETRRHGTRADLVLYRRDWASLLTLPQAQLDALARTAALNAMVAADVRHDDLGARLNRFLLPGWRESEYVYDGVTVFFEDSPTDATLKPRFARFFTQFLEQLVLAMQKTGRSYQINIAVPGAQLGEDGAYSFGNLMHVLETAEPKDRATKGMDRKAKDHYTGTTDLSVAFLLLLDGPLDRAAADLRARVDQSSLGGYRRIAFLESVMPMLYHQRADAAAPLPPDQADALGQSLAYIKWTYGGVSLWPAPSEGIGMGSAVHDKLREHYSAPEEAMGPLCDLACPNRLPLRLLYQAMMLTLLVGVALYVWNCRVRRLGRLFLLALWAGALLTLATAFVVFHCDPVLAQARDQGYGLYALILLLIAAAGYVVFKPRVGVP
jgi:hypothetical protein